MRFCIFFCLLTLNITITHAQQKAIDEPIRNFDFLWNTFNDRYANFDLKKVDWNQIYDTYRPLINDKTTNQDLFKISCTMLQELNDGHVTIAPDFDKKEVECGPPYSFTIDTEFPTEKALNAFEKVMDKTLLSYGFSTANQIHVSKEANFQYRVSGSLGYLRIDEMPEPTFGKLGKALRKSLAAFKDKNTVIIDLRFNGGGWDRNAYAIANRFVTKKAIGHYKKKRKKGKTEFTKLETWKLKPKGSLQFNQQIIILTSDFTASAAEVFILALQQFPNVTLIGDTTEGIFSDMYYFRMPNKWEVSLSHMKFYSSEMVNYEGQGFTPLVKAVNTKENLKKGRDTVLEKTMDFIGQNAPK